MNFAKKILAISILGTLAFFTACSVDGTDDSIDISKINSKDESSELTDVQAEFLYAYAILDYLYLFAHSDSLEPKVSQWYDRLEVPEYYVDISRDYLSDTLFQYYPSEILDIYMMYDLMNDGYTQYVDPSQLQYDEYMEQFNERETFYNTGIEVTEISTEMDSILVVSQVYLKSAAYQEGVQVGDTIVSMYGAIVNSAVLFDKLSVGEKGTSVPLTIARNENGERVEKKFDLTITPYPEPSVKFHMQDSIAIIEILSFNIENTPSDSGTYGEFIRALNETQSAKATVIDIRDNPGGYVDQCEAIAAEMLPKGTNMSIEYSVKEDVDTDVEDPTIIIDTVYTTEDGLGKDRYYVFLVTAETGSCAEYLLMTITNNLHSPVVGNTTYGKGSAFTILPTYLEGVAITTVSITYDMNHETFHMVGIKPDVEVNVYDDIPAKGIEIAKEGTMKRTAGYGTTLQPEWLPLQKTAISKFKALPKFGGMVVKRDELPIGKTNRK